MIKDSIPHESATPNELSSEEQLHRIANVPKAIADAKMKQAKKKRQKKGKK
jgi:hypothetical protein